MLQPPLGTHSGRNSPIRREDPEAPGLSTAGQAANEISVHSEGHLANGDGECGILPAISNIKLVMGEAPWGRQTKQENSSGYKEKLQSGAAYTYIPAALKGS